MKTAQKSSERVSSWDSYADYLNASTDAFERFEQRQLSRSRLSVAVAEQTLAFSDDATPDLNIQLILEGEVDIASCDMGFGCSSFTSAAGAFLVVPAFATLDLDGAGSFQLASASIPWAHVEHDLELLAEREVRDFGRLHNGMNSDELTVALMHRLVMSEFESEVAADSLFGMIATRLLLLSGENETRLLKRRVMSVSVLSRVIEFIHAHMESGVSLESLAEIAGCSRYHFCRSFKTATGVTPNEYLIRLRVECARERLNRGEILAEIAIKSGFADQSHMTRLFKRIYGITPGRFQAEAAPNPQRAI